MEENFDYRWRGASIPIDHWHFHRRLLARYGVVMTPGEFSAMLADVRSGRALAVERRARGVVIYSVRLRDSRERIYVMTARKRVLTAWPPNVRRNEMRRQLLSSKDDGASGPS